MILGVGTDICDLRRIEKLLVPEKKEAFLGRTFTAQEQALAPKNEGVAIAFYAGRWAVKEAVAKALGTGFGVDCSWLDLEVLRLDSGAPNLQLHGKTLLTAERRGIESWHVSISHERDYAVAFVVAEN